MSVLAAILTAIAIASAQVLHGGLLVPFLMVPSAVLLVLAALPGMVAAARNSSPAAPATFLLVTAWVAYLSWRCLQGGDQFLGRVEMGPIFMGGLAFMLGCAGMNSNRARFVLLGILGGLAAGQAMLGFFQIAQAAPSAPLGWFSLSLKSIYEERFLNRAHGLFLNPNQLSWFMGWGALFALSLACWGRVNGIARVVLIYFALMFVSADVLTGSRGGLLGLLAGLATFAVISVTAVLTTMRRGRWPVLLMTLSLIVLCLGAGVAIYSSNWIMQGRVDAIRVTGDLRSYLLEHAWRQFQVAPLMGQGPGSFLYAARLYRVGFQEFDAVFAHNDWLQVLVEYGMAGFAGALLVVLLALAGGIRRFFALLKSKDQSGNGPQSNQGAVLLGAISAVVAFGVHALADFNLHVPANLILGATTLGLVVGTGNAMTERKPAGRFLATGIRTANALVMICLAAVLALFLWRHAAPDYYALSAQNRLSNGDVWSSLQEAEKGLKWEPAHAELLALRAEGLYSYESALQLTEGRTKWATTGDIPPEVGNGDWTPARRAEVYEGAVKTYQQALHIQPREKHLHIKLADALREIRRYRSAERQYVEAIALDPAHAHAYENYGGFLYDQGQFLKALRIFEIGRTLPGGGPCWDQYWQLQEELHPAADDEAEPAPTEATP